MMITFYLALYTFIHIYLSTRSGKCCLQQSAGGKESRRAGFFVLKDTLSLILNLKYLPSFFNFLHMVQVYGETHQSNIETEKQ